MKRIITLLLIACVCVATIEAKPRAARKRATRPAAQRNVSPRERGHVPGRATISLERLQVLVSELQRDIRAGKWRSTHFTSWGITFTRVSLDNGTLHIDGTYDEGHGPIDGEEAMLTACKMLNQFSPDIPRAMYQLDQMSITTRYKLRLTGSICRRELTVSGIPESEEYGFVKPIVNERQLPLGVKTEETRVPDDYTVSDKYNDYVYYEKHEGPVEDRPDVMPQFPGGDRALLGFLADNVHYPAHLQRKGVEGLSIVTFIIEKDGSVSGVDLMKSSGESELDSEAMRVVTKLPRFIPGMVHDKPVRTRYTLPVRFKLQ